MAELSTFIAKVKQTVRDPKPRFTDPEKEAFIQQAVRQYSKDRPRLLDFEFIGDGSKQEFDTPDDWKDRFSRIIILEFPVDEVPRQKLRLQDSVEIVLKSGVEKIVLIRITLAIAEKARIIFNTQHVLTSVVDSSTIPDLDFDAVCDLSASFLAHALAANYAHSTDSSISEDVVDRAAQATLFGDRGDSLFKAYKEHIETADVAKPALKHFDIDVNFTWGSDLLFHPRRNR